MFFDSVAGELIRLNRVSLLQNALEKLADADIDYVQLDLKKSCIKLKDVDFH
jgi:hypothetical protein